MFSDRSTTATESDALERAVDERRRRGETLLDVRCERLEVTGEREVASSAPLLASLLLLCDPGDELLVPEPGGASLVHAAQLAGLSLAPYPLVFEERWRLDAETLWEAIGERTRAIVAISPNDVTGSVLSAAELETLDALELPLILDARLSRGPISPEDNETPASSPLWLTLHERRIALRGTDALVAEARERLAAIESVLGTKTTRTKAEEQDVALAFEALQSALAKSSVVVPRIEGGSTAAIRLPGDDDERAALALLDEGVIATPGRRLGLPDDEAWLVLDLRAGAEAMRRAGAALVAISSRDAPNSR